MGDGLISKVVDSSIYHLALSSQWLMIFGKIKKKKKKRRKRDKEGQKWKRQSKDGRKRQNKVLVD